MLRNLKEIKGFKIQPANREEGNIGKVKDIYFDDENWKLRYFVADTGGWLTGRDVLITPHAVQEIDWNDERVLTHLSKTQIEQSPGIETDQPVSRQYEVEYHRYFGYPYYWAGGLYPAAYTAGMLTGNPPPVPPSEVENRGPRKEDPHLRSMNEVLGYGIRTLDHEEFGRVENLIVEDESWTLRYFQIDTNSFWPGGKKLLIAPEWIEDFNWSDQLLVIHVDRDSIDRSPHYEPSKAITRPFEKQVAESFGKPEYWSARAETTTGTKPPLTHPRRF
jgi:hypothetical protein